MKPKSLPPLLALLATGFAGHAQVKRSVPTDNVADTTSIAYDLRNTFSTLDASRLRTGILMDRIPVVSNPHDYDGSANKGVNSYGNWQQQYWEYYQASGSQGLSPAALRAQVTERVNAQQVPLLMLSYGYDELVPDAAAKGLIRIDSVQGRIYDGPNTSASPYQQRTLFAVSYAAPLPADGPVSVYIGSEFWLGSTPPPATLLIDFGDGYGQRQVAMNSTVVLRSYETPPTQPVFDQITSKPVTVEQSPAVMNMLSVTIPQSGLQAFAQLWSTTTLPVLPDMVLGLKASHTWNGYAAASALGWVKWGNGNTTGKFRKPLVFVEGIDFGCDGAKNACSILTPSQTSVITNQVLSLAAFTGTYRNGTAGWNEMVAYNSDFVAVEKLPALRDQLTQQGYDIIYLDFSDGATHIQSNAMTLVELLDYINNPNNRTTDATETIVTAASMGGQVARFALTWMEQQSLCHNSKLYVSIDSPHRGANIPLGLQYMIDRMSDVWIFGGKFGMKRDALLRPAAKQMMLYHFSPDAVNPRAQWQNWQASPNSYPGLLRKVAIANGNRSGQTLPGAFPGMELLHTGPITPWWGSVYSNSMPGASSRGNNNVIFRYRKPFTLTNKWHYTQVASNSPTIDQAPGGTRASTVDAANESYGTLRSGSDYQTFIPVISALDVSAAGSIGQSSTNFYYNIGSNLPDPTRPNPTKYAFEAYYAPSGISEPHINITNGQGSQQGNPSYSSDNTTWLLNELRESAHNLPQVLAGTYNYGSLYRRLLPSVRLASGGQLFINNANLPNSGGVNTANDAKENSLEVYTSSCGSIVQVDQGGRLTLGQPNDGHTGTLRIANKSLLDLRSGAQTVVNAGSVLRIQRGGTLVVRSGSTLTIAGQVIVEDGAYICVENSGSIATTGNGTYTVSPSATYSANPALGLSNLACSPQSSSPLYLSISSLEYLPYCTNNSGRSNYARWIATATGGTGVYNYTWEFDAGSGSGFYPTNVTGNSYGTCLNYYASARYVQVRVTATSGTQRATALYYAMPQFVLYPNPADTYVEVAGEDKSPDFATSAVATQPQARAAATSAAPASDAPAIQVTVYNNQGKVVFEKTAHTEAAQHINTATWPNGLYQVTIREGATTTRRQLSVQH